MPRIKIEHDSGKKTTKRPKKVISQQTMMNNQSDSACSEENLEIPDSPDVSDGDNHVAESEENFPQDFSGEMNKLLERFNSGITKTMQAKRRKLEQFTAESTRSTTKKVLETNKNQSMERRKLIDHFQDRFTAMVQQGESELEKMKEAEEKLQKLLTQQQKQQQQLRITHNQRIKDLKSLSEEFCKGMNELEECHVEQYSSVHNELRKEMALLQKRILMDTQQQEMSNIRNHLKQLIA